MLIEVVKVIQNYRENKSRKDKICMYVHTLPHIDK